MELQINSPNSKNIYFESLEKILRDVGEDTIKEDTKITPLSKFSEDLGLDSLDLYEFLYRVEEEFKITIPDEKANQLRTIEDYSFYLRNRNR